MIERLYGGIDAPRLYLEPAESELLKYACNAFHALKIDFANEIGTVASTVGADPTTVMDALCQDRRLNVSAAYLKPGFAFGGSCLPKDTTALAAAATRDGLSLPLLASILPSNEAHLQRQIEMVLSRCRGRRTLLLGLSFKTGTDDLRQSPMVRMAAALLKEGVQLTIHDSDLHGAQLLGANASYAAEHLPGLVSLLAEDLDDAVPQAQVVILAKPVAGANLANHMVIDLTDAQNGGEQTPRQSAAPNTAAA
jgi:GDP-mannose 6-dehydrogenase